ncbi:TPA: hypothetical protein N3F75_000109 [Klebsiella aerogenes]|nr:hypothetical protein [Klebsiella aerogenes]
MNVFEMEGFLRGKCLPGDLKVNESNAEYLVRKLRAVSELQGEVTALVATLGKSREVSGCPEGIDLQDWVKQMAAENLAMKQAIDQHRCGFVVCPSCSLEISSSTDDVCYVLDGTPATDRIVAGIKADGVEEWVSSRGGRWNGTTEEALKFAKKLREGADK